MNTDGRRANITASLLKKRQSLTRQNSISCNLCSSPGKQCPYTKEPCPCPLPLPSSPRTNRIVLTTNQNIFLKKRQNLAEHQSLFGSQHQNSLVQEAIKEETKKRKSLSDQGPSTSLISKSATSRAKKDVCPYSQSLARKRKSLENCTTSTGGSVTQPHQGNISDVSSSQDGAGPSTSQMTFSKLAASNGYFTQVLRVSWNIIGQLILTI